jgi:hypothetical protein
MEYKQKSIRYFGVGAIVVGMLLATLDWQPGLKAVADPAIKSVATTAISSEDLRTSVLSATTSMTTSLAPAVTYKVYLSFIARPNDEKNWSMAGANPQRTSWTAEEVRGQLAPEWYRVIDGYIPPHVQIIAANGALFVSTAKGLYALDAGNGSLLWLFSTEMPLGNSPTIANGVAYVGGFDHKLYAIDVATGAQLWAFEAGAGFDTNPLVVNGRVYLGNRDGYFYAIYANEDAARKGTLAWRYQTGGPIHFSAAIDKSNSVLYFASDDTYAYALNAQTGSLVWKSAKLPSAGFHSWWPTVTDQAVVFSAARPYRFDAPPQTNPLTDYTLGEPGLSGGFGAPNASGVRDATNVLDYFETKPWLRSYYILSPNTGVEITYDFNNNGKPEYAPLLSAGTHSGNRYPAMIGSDGKIYTFNKYSSNKYGQAVSAWSLGANTITTPNIDGLTARDEPLAYSGGGSLIYWTQCCDRSGGAYDMQGHKWTYYTENLPNLTPGYNVKTTGTVEANAVTVYGDWNGVYGYHGDQNPPIPYNGKVYVHRSNAIIAFSAKGGSHAVPSTSAPAVSNGPRQVDVNALQAQLVSEVQKMVDAGHLRPGFGVYGAFAEAAVNQVGDHSADLWSNPLDTVLALSLAYPHLPATLQAQVKTYLQTEMSQYNPCSYTHIGWNTGAGREAYDLPPEVTADFASVPKSTYSSMDFPAWTGPDWKWTPHTFYALWKYAQVLGNAKALFDGCRSRLTAPPNDSVLAAYPFAHNAWIAGYYGYLQLQQLAGYSADPAKQATLDHLLQLRASQFNANNPWGPNAHNWGQVLSVARNFLYLTPELGQYLHDHALSTMTAAFNKYASDAPYWFVSNFEAAYNEITIQPVYDSAALFAANAFIFMEPRGNLVKYLDVPSVARGDLFYIQNLVYTIEAASN